MGKGRKAIPPEFKDKKVYKKTGDIERQKDAAPKGYPSNLPCPKGLTEGAKKEWRRVVRLLKQGDTQVVNNLDSQMLAIYCAETDIYNRLYEKWQSEGCQVYITDATDSASTERTPSGTPIKSKQGRSQKTILNPIFDMIQKYANAIRVHAEQLGLTPVGRAGWTVRTANREKSAAEEFMGDE